MIWLPQSDKRRFPPRPPSCLSPFVSRARSGRRRSFGDTACTSGVLSKPPPMSTRGGAAGGRGGRCRRNHLVRANAFFAFRAPRNAVRQDDDNDPLKNERELPQMLLNTYKHAWGNRCFPGLIKQHKQSPRPLVLLSSATAPPALQTACHQRS